MAFGTLIWLIGFGLSEASVENCIGFWRYMQRTISTINVDSTKNKINNSN